MLKLTKEPTWQHTLKCLFHDCGFRRYATCEILTTSWEVDTILLYILGSRSSIYILGSRYYITPYFIEEEATKMLHNLPIITLVVRG